MDKNNVQNLRRMQPGSFFSGYTLMYTFFLIDCYIVYTYTSMYFGVTLMIIYINAYACSALITNVTKHIQY